MGEAFWHRRCVGRPYQFWLDFQKLWVSSTLAAFIVALVANLPAILPKQLSVTTNPSDSIGVLSYLYLVWMLWYFLCPPSTSVMLPNGRP